MKKLLATITILLTSTLSAEYLLKSNTGVTSEDFTSTTTSEPDSNWNNVVLLSYFDGIDGANTFTDEAGHSIIYSGSPVTTTSTKKHGSSSVQFDGSSYLEYVTTNGDFALTGDYTVEMWFKPQTQSVSYEVLVANTTRDGLGITVWNNGSIGMGRSLRSTDLQTGGSVVNFEQWNHLAISRESGMTRIFLNGNMASQASLPTSYLDGNITLGIDGNRVQFPFNGHIDDFRITNGIARYTSNFSVPTQAPSNN